MSITNAKLTVRRAVVLCDTAIQGGPISKVLILPHLPAVLASRGHLSVGHDFCAIVNAERIGDIADLDVEAVGEKLRPIADASPARVGPNRADFLAIGYSPRRRRCLAHIWFSEGQWAETAKNTAIAMPATPYTDEVWPPSEPSVDDALVAYRTQYADLMRLSPRPNFGGDLVAVEIEGPTMTMHTVPDPMAKHGGQDDAVA